MDKKPPSKKPIPASRHRFVDNGETMVMPLAEILRSRDAVFDEMTPDVKGESEFDEATSVRLRTPQVRAKPHQPAPSNQRPPDDNTRSKARAPQAMPVGLTPTGSVSAPLQSPPPRLTPAQPPASQQARQSMPPAAAPAPVQAPPVQPPAAERTQMVSPAQLPRQAPEASKEASEAAEPRNQVVVFFACKGGAGATALSLNVAHHYAREQYTTCLVDLDLQLGDALAALALQPRITIAQATGIVAGGAKVTPGQLPQHASGVTVLSQVGSLDDLDKVSPEGLASLVENLREGNDVVVVDGVRDFSDNVLAVLDVADKIAIVTVQEVLAVRRARWSFNILRKIGFDPKDITVVINRYNAQSEIPFQTVQRIFDPSQVMTIPSDFGLVTQSLNRGVPLQELSPQHSLTRNIGRLANNLVGNAVPEENEVTAIGKLSFWQKLRGK